MMFTCTESFSGHDRVVVAQWRGQSEAVSAAGSSGGIDGCKVVLIREARARARLLDRTGGRRGGRRRTGGRTRRRRRQFHPGGGRDAARPLRRQADQCRRQRRFSCQLHTTDFPCYGPDQITHAYQIDQTGLTGSGRTIVIIDAFQDPFITGLQDFDTCGGFPIRRASTSSPLTV